MSNNLQAVRGTKDLLPEDKRIFNDIVATAKRISSLYGFDEVSTPIFEFVEVFKRTLGQDSDVVGKEMYEFADKGGDMITLRPEFTAAIARMFISNGLTHQLPGKYFSYGPLFRYERPQKCRQRQFHQINFEFLGVDKPQADIEIIAMATNLVRAFGIEDKVRLEINSLGDNASRIKYRTALVEYLSGYSKELSPDSQKRLQSNPMRILDSKNENDKKIVEGAPKMAKFYSDDAKKFFDYVQEGLTNLSIDFTVNSKLVRGLDYYCHTAFEITTTQLGSQNAVLAGGRYDGLIKVMGGPDTPAIGFAGGIERIAALSNKAIPKAKPVFIIPIGDRAEGQLMAMAEILRQQNIYVEYAYSGSIKKRMKKADSLNSEVVIIFGDDEIDQNIVKLKVLETGEEKSIQTDMLLDAIKQYV